MAGSRPRRISLAAGEADLRRGSPVGRYLSCLRYREILLLQGSPLLGAAFSMRKAGGGSLGALLVFVPASVLLVAHIFLFNAFAGMQSHLTPPPRPPHAFS